MKLKTLIFTLAILLFSLPVCAGEITITVGEYSKTYSNDYVRVIETDMLSITDWCFNAFEEEHRRALEGGNTKKFSSNIIPEFRMKAPLSVTIGNETRIYDAEFVRVLESRIGEPLPQHVFFIFERKHRSVLNRIVYKKASINPKGLTVEEKHNLIKNIALESAKDRQARFEAKMKAELEK